MRMQQTDRLETAARFINSTNSHLFLTGKAGTGKTTFLKQLYTGTGTLRPIHRSRGLLHHCKR